jgi:hypothetical protein
MVSAVFFFFFSNSWFCFSILQYGKFGDFSFKKLENLVEFKLEKKFPQNIANFYVQLFFGQTK